MLTCSAGATSDSARNLSAARSLAVCWMDALFCTPAFCTCAIDASTLLAAWCSLSASGFRPLPRKYISSGTSASPGAGVAAGRTGVVGGAAARSRSSGAQGPFHLRPAQAFDAAHPLVHKLADGLGGLLLFVLGAPVGACGGGEGGLQGGGFAGHVLRHFVCVAAGRAAGLHGAGPQQPFQRGQALGGGADALERLGALGLGDDGFFDQRGAGGCE